VICILNKADPCHDYVFEMYLRQLGRYLVDHRHDVRLVDNLSDAIGGTTVVADASFFTEPVVDRLHSAECRVVAFSLTDSSWPDDVIKPHLAKIDKLFMVTGIQTTNMSREVVVDEDFNITLEPRRFMDEAMWTIFDTMRRAGRIHSLPYVYWNPQPDHIVRRPFSGRSRDVVIRGGSHFKRVLLALFLLRAKRLDGNSGFTVADYFLPRMVDQFRYCQLCRDDFTLAGGRSKLQTIDRPDGCNSPAEWGGDSLHIIDQGAWNNRCPTSYYWLAKKFQDRYGEVDTDLLKKIMVVDMVGHREHFEMLNRAMFTGDLKWIHSIYAAQRFWDGAISGCVNFMPSRIDEQEFFPAMYNGDHYVTFTEDFSNLEHELDIDQDKYEFISNNTRILYDHWIKPTDYRLNTNLLRHISDIING
jgi:hypothetical protein